MSLDINVVRSIVTIAAFAAFVAVVWWAFAPSRKAEFEKKALAVFDGDEK
jgi:cbb3-type cytochrome oxidase subunit 3